MGGAIEFGFLLLAGVVAGIIGTAGGITSLVSYPALLLLGITPLAANITNAVALLGSGFGSALRARPDLAGHGVTLKRWMPSTVLFSFIGAVLLVTTPAELFNLIVPFLIAGGSIILFLQPRIAGWQARRAKRSGRLAVAAGGTGVALYNGYFGAGSGILMIAILLLTTEPVLYKANSLKNVILVAADVLPAILFAVLGTVIWSAVWPLGIGALVGGLVGPTVARRVPQNLLRMLVAACGLILAVWLLASAAGW